MKSDENDNLLKCDNLVFNLCIFSVKIGLVNKFIHSVNKSEEILS